MKKKIITLLFAVAMSAVFSASVMAAEGEKMNGFYDIGEGENVEITVFSGDAEVSATEKNVDEDEELELWYQNSNKLGVTYAKTVDGAYYGVVLVDGKGLPTKDSTIYYLNQKTAEDDEGVDFTMAIKAPQETTDMSLYIASDEEGFKLVNIPLNYAVNVEVYTPGDVNGDNDINTDDIILTRRFITGGWGVSIIESAADVDADSKYTAKDVILMRRYVAGGYGVELK